MKKLFNPEDLLLVDKEANKHFLKQAVYQYGDNYELSIVSNDDVFYEYEFLLNSIPNKLRYFQKSGLKREDVENLMFYVSLITGHSPSQV
jgi:hypothetical protein